MSGNLWTTIADKLVEYADGDETLYGRAIGGRSVNVLYLVDDLDVADGVRVEGGWWVLYGSSCTHYGHDGATAAFDAYADLDSKFTDHRNAVVWLWRKPLDPEDTDERMGCHMFNSGLVAIAQEMLGFTEGWMNDQFRDYLVTKAEERK